MSERGRKRNPVLCLTTGVQILKFIMYHHLHYTSTFLKEKGIACRFSLQIFVLVRNAIRTSLLIEKLNVYVNWYRF